MNQIHSNLYQFTSYIPPMNFTIHQYLLKSNPAILFATGTIQQARQNLPQIQSILGAEDLKYIFVSHIESDECGGLSVFHEAYPNAKVICSPLAARELPGYGYDGEVIVGSPDTPIQDGSLDLLCISYPSEVHLQDGLVCFDKT